MSTFHWFQQYLADGKPNVMEHVESCVQSIWALWQSVYFYPFNDYCHAYQACMTTGELRAMAEERGCAAVGGRDQSWLTHTGGCAGCQSCVQHFSQD
jgi:hypothetical protein